MADLNLEGQSTEASTINPKLLAFKNLLDQRKTIWQRIPFAKRKAWILSDKDPIMSAAWDTYKYLSKNFFGVGYHDDYQE